MGFVEAYRASLKPSEVEEPIDAWFHRPLGHVIAYTSNPIKFISPDLITVMSIVFGWASGAMILYDVPYHMQIAALLLTVSVALDCADGQLARMRKSSSPFGRMLDGVADLLVIIAVAPLSLWYVFLQYSKPEYDPRVKWVVAAMGIATIVTSSFHTGMYDHYKNVWFRFTSPGYKEGEDSDTAKKRYNDELNQGNMPLWKRLFWFIYLFYVKSQEDTARKFDPEGEPILGRLPPYDPRYAEIFRKHELEPFRWLRGWFGFGSLVFGIQFIDFFECGIVMIFFRLFIMNGVFYLWIRPQQRKASKKIFEEIEALGEWKRHPVKP